MSQINISALQNVGPFNQSMNVSFSGYINGKIQIINNNGGVIAYSRDFDHEQSTVIVGPIVANTQFSAVVVADVDPSFHGQVSMNSGKNGFSSADVLQTWKSKYGKIRIYKRDSYGTKSQIFQGAIDEQFYVNFEDNSLYEIELICSKGNDGEDNPCSCVDQKIFEFYKQSLLTANVQSVKNGNVYCTGLSGYDPSVVSNTGIGPFYQQVSVKINGTVNGSIIIASLSAMNGFISELQNGNVHDNVYWRAKSGFYLVDVENLTSKSYVDQTVAQIGVGVPIAMIIISSSSFSPVTSSTTISIIPEISTSTINKSLIYDTAQRYVGEYRKYFKIFKTDHTRTNRSTIYNNNISDDFSISIDDNYIYEVYVACTCSPTTVLSFDVSEYSNCDLTPYQDATQYGLSDGTPWRLIETGYPWKYFEGTVVNGKFEGLPDSFRPVRYTYTGHMILQAGCFNQEAVDAGCEWDTEYEYHTCVQHDGPSFTSAQTVDLSRYIIPSATDFGDLYEGMTWGLYDTTHNVFALQGVYANGRLMETNGSTSAQISTQTQLRNSYTSLYNGESSYKFILRCDAYYPTYNWYVVGFCAKRMTDVVNTQDNPFTGNLGTLYVIIEGRLYPSGTYYDNKRMNILSGPYTTQAIAEDFKSSHSSSLLATLEQQCQNRATLDITWESSGGCDLDISFLVEGVTMGWSQSNDSPYATWYGDNTGCGGAEQVSIDKNAMIAAGITTATTIRIRAHWYGTRGDGNSLLTVSDGDKSQNRIFNFITYESSSSNYDDVGSVTINLVTDEITISGGAPQTTSSTQALLSALPEDLQ